MMAGKPLALALALEALVCVAACFLNVRGLHLAKWLTGATSILWFGTCAILAYLLGTAWIFGTPLARGSLSFHSPEVARSIAIAAPFIALMYTLGTASLLAYAPAAQIDVAAAVPQ